MTVILSDDTSGDNEVIVTIVFHSGHTYSLVYSGKMNKNRGIYKDLSNKSVEGALAIRKSVMICL